MLCAGLVGREVRGVCVSDRRPCFCAGLVGREVRGVSDLQQCFMWVLEAEKYTRVSSTLRACIGLAYTSIVNSNQLTYYVA